MRIGLVLTSSAKMVSVKHVMASVRDALADHELVYPHPSIAWAPEDEQLRIATEFLSGCDAIVGLLHPAVLTMRQRLGMEIPYFFLMLGIMPRGAFGMQPYLSQMTDRDSLVVNSEADRRICELFFSNAHVPVVPLAYDPESFFPLDSGQRAEIRRELGFGEESRVILYSGRLTPEKNVHTVLRAFGALAELVPDLHLVLAGRILPVSFQEFGVTPIRFPQALSRAAQALVREPERVLFAGPVPPSELREFYNIADVFLNLTLHHDENFGLAQVEAMACGLPVVGSCWGGLKDTIAEGRTGHGVSTHVTPLGVKVNWWEAVVRTLEFLEEPAAGRRVRDEGPRYAAALYSPARLRETLGTLIRSRVGRVAGRGAEPLHATEFAKEFWSTCDPTGDLRAPYRRGDHSMALYRRMIEPYAGLSPDGVPAGESLHPDQVLCLAVPLVEDGLGALWPDDPLYPLRCPVPDERREGVEALVRAFRGRPVTHLRNLETIDPAPPDLMGTLEWMIQSGLVLRSRPERFRVDPVRISGRAGVPVFTFQRLPGEGIDFIVSG